MFTTALREQESGKANPWNGLKVADDIADRDKRRSFTLTEAKAILAELPKSLPDLKRIGLITACTGARLTEVSGLDAEDVNLIGDVPYVWIRPNDHRTLKNKSSRRMVPLIGPALEAAREALEAHPTGALFPHYAERGRGFDAVSAALNKMLRDRVKLEDPSVTWHSWRHTMKDWLRNAKVSKELQDAILGHSSAEVSAAYGDGFDLKMMKEGLEHALTAQAML